MNAVSPSLFTLPSGLVYILYKIQLVFNNIVVYTLLTVDGKRRSYTNSDGATKNTLGSLRNWKLRFKL
jgi:hypothetical protein